jgi:hypothetical protein
LSQCGWALASVTRPCVAQRVCPIPIVAGDGRYAAGAGLLLDSVLEELEVADRPHRVDLAVGQQREPGGVIAAVLEPFEALQK